MAESKKCNIDERHRIYLRMDNAVFSWSLILICRRFYNFTLMSQIKWNKRRHRRSQIERAFVRYSDVFGALLAWPLSPPLPFGLNHATPASFWPCSPGLFQLRPSSARVGLLEAFISAARNVFGKRVCWAFVSVGFCISISLKWAYQITYQLGKCLNGK